VSQRAPGGLQSSIIFEPILDKAARSLGLDQYQIRVVNAPETGSEFGMAPPGAPPGRGRTKVTSAFVKEALQKGHELFNWEERKKKSGQRRGNKVTGVSVTYSTFTAGSIGVDGLAIIRPDGKMQIHQGIGNLGTHSVIDTARVYAEILDFPWEKCEVVWGNTGKGVPWSSIQAGSQTTHAHTRANYAAAMDAKRKLQEIAATDLGGSPDDYDVGNERVFRKGSPGRGLSFAQAAERALALGGKFDGHELPKDINAMTRDAGNLLKGIGLMAVAKDNVPRDGQTYGFMVAFAEVEVDVETGVYRMVDYLGVADVGTVIHPNSLGGQIHGGAIQGMGHVKSQNMVYDPHYGAALAKRLHHNKPPTILDVPLKMDWAAVEIPDPQNPIGAKGIGEPGIGVGGASLLCAIADAVGHDIIRRTPVHPESIVTGLAAGKPAHERLTAYI
jgi:xanthine dehydrogenase molybdenum-binding subunit